MRPTGTTSSPSERSDATQAYRRLRRMIVGGEMAPGSPVVETATSDRVPEGRTPVRAALIRLRGEGFLVEGQGQFRVRPLTARDVRELCHLLGSVEECAASHSALASPQERMGLTRRLRQATEALEKIASSARPDIQRLCEAERSYGRQLIGAGGGPRLTEFGRSRRAQFERYMRTYFQAAWIRASRAVRAQRATTDAVEAGDAETACDEVRELWRDTARMMTDAIGREGPQGRW